MSKQLILFLLFAMMHYMTVAQNYRVAGTVSDKTNRERLEGVNVLLYVGKEKKLLKFTTTTTEGSFKTIPLPDTFIRTFAVPKSIPISLATLVPPVFNH